jgi:hypothetical protein
MNASEWRWRGGKGSQNMPFRFEFYTPESSVLCNVVKVHGDTLVSVTVPSYLWIIKEVSSSNSSDPRRALFPVPTLLYKDQGPSLHKLKSSTCPNFPLPCLPLEFPISSSSGCWKTEALPYTSYKLIFPISTWSAGKRQRR